MKLLGHHAILAILLSSNLVVIGSKLRSHSLYYRWSWETLEAINRESIPLSLRFRDALVKNFAGLCQGYQRG